MYRVAKSQAGNTELILAVYKNINLKIKQSKFCLYLWNGVKIAN